jgi:hypothetical protein
MADRDLTSPYLSASRRATQASHAGVNALQDNLNVANAYARKPTPCATDSGLWDDHPLIRAIVAMIML